MPSDSILTQYISAPCTYAACYYYPIHAEEVHGLLKNAFRLRHVGVAVVGSKEGRFAA